VFQAGLNPKALHFLNALQGFGLRIAVRHTPLKGLDFGNPIAILIGPESDGVWKLHVVIELHDYSSS
jgi:hypothetical protein